MADAKHLSTKEAYDLMRNDGREMYLGRHGGWYLTFGGGPLSDEQANDIINSPGIVPRYHSNGVLHRDCFAYGKTIDLDEMQRRRRTGKLASREVVYVDGTTGFPR